MAKKKTTKYGPETHAVVEREMKAMHEGKLRSGGDFEASLRSGGGEKVTDRRQAIAIALSEARREGDKVPPNPNQLPQRNAAEERKGRAAKAAKKTPGKKTAGKKSAGNRTAGKRASTAEK